REPALGDVEPGHDLQAGGETRGKVCGGRDHVVEQAVHPEAHRDGALVGLDVDVAGAVLDGLEEERVHQPDDRCLVARLEEVERLAERVLGRLTELEALFLDRLHGVGGGARGGVVVEGGHRGSRPRGCHDGPTSSRRPPSAFGIDARMRSRCSSEVSAICSSEEITCGVRKTSRLVFMRRPSRLRKRAPRTGIFPRYGTERSSWRIVSARSPPMTTVWPSRAATAVLAVRTVVVGPTWVGSPTDVGSMSETSSKSVSRTKSSAVICGVMRSITPTSWRSMVVKRFCRLVALVARLATKGTLRPTTISASSLSVVTMFGAERTFTSVSVSSAVSSTVWAGTWRPSGSVTMWLLAAARMRPGSDVGSLSAPPGGNERFALASPRCPSSPVPAWNSTPSERSLSIVASRMIASTNTWRRRTSSFSMTPRSVAQSSGVALTMRVLVAGSAVIRTGASIGMVPAAPAEAGSASGGGGAAAGGGAPSPPS